MEKLKFGASRLGPGQHQRVSMPPDDWMSVRPSDDDAKEPVVENGLVNGTKEEWRFSFDMGHYLFLLGYELRSLGFSYKTASRVNYPYNLFL